MMLGFLLARAGVRVVVLEKHADFFRDFRGDTVHPSTLEIMFELGLIDVAAEVRGGRTIFADNCYLTEAGREFHADAVATALAPTIKALLESRGEP